MFTSVRVRSMMFVLLLVTPISANETEDHAARYFKKLGAQVSYLRGEHVTDVRLWWYINSVTDEDMKKLTAFKHLKILWLHSPKVTDQGVKSLAELKELEWLEVGGQVTDAGLKPLTALKKLKILRLPHNVTGTGLKDLTALEHLVELHLGSGMLNDEGMKFVGQMKNLEILNINFTKITDAGLKHLAGLKKLRKLDVGANHITDKGMEALAALTELRELGLSGITRPDMTGASFGDLAPLQKLEILDLESMPHLRAANLKKLAVLKNLQVIDARGSVPADFSPLSGVRVVTKDPHEDDRNHDRRRREPLLNDGTAHIVVRVMSDAEIWFNGDKTSQTGWHRMFVSPVLMPGKRYSYEIRARWTENGKVVEQTRTVEVQANHRAFVDFFKASTPAGPK